MSTAAITIAALLVASPSLTDADHIAANGGFLLGNAHRCGIEDSRVTHAGQLVRTLISAASSDDKAEEAATARFSAFFLVSAVADPKIDKLVASCKRITAELRQLENHHVDQALVGSNDEPPAKSVQEKGSFGPGDGE
jgi:predicted GH43/DUF377 family glycosyl hydrolase